MPRKAAVIVYSDAGVGLLPVTIEHDLLKSEFTLPTYLPTDRPPLPLEWAGPFCSYASHVSAHHVPPIVPPLPPFLSTRLSTYSLLDTGG